MSEPVPATSPWPPVAFETRGWVSGHEQGEASCNQLRRHRGPYEAAVPPAIARTPLSLPSSLVAVCAEASAELTRFDAELGSEIAPFASVLLRSESAASSQIENLTASARAISEAELGERGGYNAVQVVGNVAAMSAATALSHDLTAGAILGMHAALMQNTGSEAGSWRSEQVWIGGSRLGPHAAVFVPPHHERVPSLVEDLVRFLARDDIPPLAHAAIAHAQFETIHPFIDGNGRTGRALVHAMLRQGRLTRHVTVPLSAGLLRDTAAYIDTLTAYRRGQPEEVVAGFADAAFIAVVNGRTLVTELRTIRARWDEVVQVRRGSTAWRIADLLLRRPVLDAASVAAELGIASQNVYRSIQPLVDAGVVVASGSGGRRLWRADEVLAVLDAFAQRAGRRR